MKTVEILKGLLVTQLNHLIIFITGITVSGVSGSGELYTAQLVLLGLLPFAFYLIRYFAEGIMGFTFLHILTAAAAAYLLISPLWGNIVPVLMFTLFIAGYLVLSVVVRIRNKNKLEGLIHHLLSIVIFVIMMLMQRFQGTEGLDLYYLIALIVYIGLFFIHLYFLNFGKFVSKTDGDAGSAVKRAIFRNGIKLVILFTAVVAVVISLLTQISTPPVSMPEISITAEAPVNTSELPVPELPPEDSYNPRTLDSFWVYAGPAVTALLIAFIFVSGIVLLFRIMSRNSKMASGKKEQDTDPDIDVHEKVSVIKTKSGARRLFRYFSPRERIRRIFKKRVLEGKSILLGDRDCGLLSMFTAHECRAALGDRVPASLYDKARYSNLECTMQDVKACKVK